MRWRLGLVAALFLAATGRLGAQQQPPAPSGRCDINFSARNPGSPPHVTQRQQPSGKYNTFLGGGVIVRCPAQSMTLIADSAEHFGDRQLVHLIGHVHYTEPRLTLDSDVAYYFMAEERLRAEGKVHTVLPSGTTLDGPRIDYYRAVPNVRAVASMIAPGRPTIKVVQKDSTGKPSEPMTVIANTVTMRGDSLVYASGRVEITRPDVLATGDSAALDSGREFARLMRGPSITARGDRPFTLTGNLIDLYGRNRLIERVVSQGNAKGVSRDATLTADTLEFRMADGRLQRVNGWGKSRAHAASPTYDVVADSLDVRMPDQRLREVRALRDAYAQSLPDTLQLHTRERDWMRGDTIFAYFDSSAAAVADTSKQPALRQLVALGHARSFYQIAARDTAALGPAVNYVRGDEITVVFNDQAVQTVSVVGQTAGVYLDPLRPGQDTTQRADTASTARQRRTP